jgi:catechol-2,3-dioxygenase
MDKLRHLALLTHQPDKLADYSKRVFDMKEMYRTKNGSVHLSDGEVNLAILNASDPKEPGHPVGLYHFGFHVEDNKEVTARINEVYPAGAPKERKATYAEGRATDPDGNLIDISAVGWGAKLRMDLQLIPESSILARDCQVNLWLSA